MGDHRRRFRQTFLIGVVAGSSSAVGACSSGDDQGEGVTPVPTASDAGEGGAAPSTSGGATSSPSGGTTPRAGTGGTSASTGGSDSKTASGGNGTGAGGRSGGTGVGGSNAGGGGASTGGTKATAGNGGSNTSDPDCPKTLAEAFPYTAQYACDDPGSVCELPLEGCASGAQFLTVTCTDGKWRPSACDQPFDYCPAKLDMSKNPTPSVYCEDGTWQVETWLINLADGPAGCPADSPDGEECRARGGTGGSDREACGYPCGGESPEWTVVTCVPDPDESVAEGVWTADGACE